MTTSDPRSPFVSARLENQILLYTALLHGQPAGTSTSSSARATSGSCASCPQIIPFFLSFGSQAATSSLTLSKSCLPSINTTSRPPSSVCAASSTDDERINPAWSQGRISLMAHCVLSHSWSATSGSSMPRPALPRSSTIESQLSTPATAAPAVAASATAAKLRPLQIPTSSQLPPLGSLAACSASQRSSAGCIQPGTLAAHRTASSGVNGSICGLCEGLS